MMVLSTERSGGRVVSGALRRVLRCVWCMSGVCPTQAYVASGCNRLSRTRRTRTDSLRTKGVAIMALAGMTYSDDVVS